ncbi:hypothetical protein [Microbispora bryophytorum]|uniref:hypothetical protein n=1 Tax=Microbispora bryophytorum TaxID=1460882 RepID=UPI0033CE1D0F
MTWSTGTSTRRRPTFWRTISGCAAWTCGSASFKHLCRPNNTGRCWYPLLVTRDESTVFADLVPAVDGREPACERRLARFFD